MVKELVIPLGDLEPLVDLFSSKKFFSYWYRCGPDHIRSHVIELFDGESDVRGHVGTVHEQGFVPFGIAVLAFDQSCSADPSFPQVNCSIELEFSSSKPNTLL